MLSEGCGFVLGVFASDMLPKYPITRSGTLIVNTEPHTESGSHWLAIHLQLLSSRLYYFDSYDLRPYISAIQSLINHNCTVWDYNTLQLQGSTTTVCANTAVSLRCTRIGVTRLKHSLGFLLAACYPPIDGCLNYLSRSLAHYPGYFREMENVTLVWGKLLLSNIALCSDCVK
jgi:hypothetical protein